MSSSLDLFMPPFGVTPNAQRILHEFSLTGRMDLSFHNIWEVLSAAQTLRIESAVISCEQFLSVTHSSHFSNIVPQPRLHLDCSKILPFTNGNPNIAELKVQPSLIGPNHSSVDLRHLRNLHCFSTFFREEIEKQSGSEKPSINGRSSACEHSEQMKSFVGTLEIAVCDGPISFKRVPNEFYQQDREATASDTSTSTETTADISLLPKPTPISKQKKERVYACPYCKETFKSLFCYEKHKRRHINPIIDHNTTRIEGKEKNVCFYPCKYCGLKFPSYYFVHKHRRFCENIRASKRT